ASAAALAILSALQCAAQDSKPSCQHCAATFISSSEIQAYLKRVPEGPNAVSDQQVRAVDVGKSNVDIGVVYRGKQSGGQAVAEHDLVSEVYHVLDGAATLVTGSDIVDLKRRPAEYQAGEMLHRPRGNGPPIRNGVTHHLKAGDMIIIPAGVGHWFTNIDDHIRYIMVRVDPDKVTPLKDESASHADLQRGK